jgi:HSP20 family protein
LLPKALAARLIYIKHIVDDSSIEAKYENGVLTLTLAKREEAKPKPARVIDVA